MFDGVADEFAQHKRRILGDLAANFGALSCGENAVPGEGGAAWLVCEHHDVIAHVIPILVGRP